MATTTNYGWTLPDVGGSNDTWGTILNQRWNGLDTLLGGVNATEFAILDGATITTTELNYLDGVTSNIQQQINNITVGGGAGDFTTINITSGASDWTFSTSGNDLIMSYGGTPKAKLDTSGNLTVVGNVTAYGTI